MSFHVRGTREGDRPDEVSVSDSGVNSSPATPSNSLGALLFDTFDSLGQEFHWKVPIDPTPRFLGRETLACNLPTGARPASYLPP